MKISVITPSLNQGRFIRQAIESVLLQQDPCFEHIVVDGGSTDDTLDILGSYQHLQWISEPDRGQSEAVNKGIAMSTGNVIGEINADDYYLPGAFARVRKAMSETGAQRACIGGCEFRRDGRTVMCWQPKDVTLQSVLCFPLEPIPHPSLFLTRDLYEAVGGLDSTIRYGPDVDLFLRLAKLTDFDVIDVPLAVSRLHPDAIQEKEWERNFTAVLYHLARHGSVDNFHEMYCRTHERFRSAEEAYHERRFLMALVRTRWEVLGLCRRRVAIMGAGSHTAWLEGVVHGRLGPEVVAVLDDCPLVGKTFFGREPSRPEEFDPNRCDGIILSSDTWAKEMADRCRTLFGKELVLVNLYEDLPPGPYRK